MPIGVAHRSSEVSFVDSFEKTMVVLIAPQIQFWCSERGQAIRKKKAVEKPAGEEAQSERASAEKEQSARKDKTGGCKRPVGANESKWNERRQNEGTNTGSDAP